MAKKKAKKKPPEKRALRLHEMVSLLAGLATIAWFILYLIDR